MTRKVNRRPPEFVVRDSKPVAVILDIEQYQEMLERLEDADDLKTLQRIRKKPLHFKKLDDFLKEYNPGV